MQLQGQLITFIRAPTYILIIVKLTFLFLALRVSKVVWILIFEVLSLLIEVFSIFFNELGLLE